MPNDVQTYTWSQFVAAVLGLLPRDSQRIGPVQPYITQMIRQAVIDLEDRIPALKMGHETIYQASDFVGEGYASRATLPPQATPRDAFLVYYDLDANHQPKPHCRRFPLEDFGWKNRMALVHSKVAVNDGRGLICFDPRGETFYVYPCPRDTQQVSLFWDGRKINFQDNEQTPFDEQMTLVVADFCKSRLSREVDNDLMMADSYSLSYRQGRQILYLNLKDRGRTNP